MPKGSDRCPEEENGGEKGRAMPFEFTTWPPEKEPLDGDLRIRAERSEHQRSRFKFWPS